MPFFQVQGHSATMIVCSAFPSLLEMTLVHIDSNNVMYHVHQARAQGGGGVRGGGGGGGVQTRPLFGQITSKSCSFFFTPNSL